MAPRKLGEIYPLGLRVAVEVDEAGRARLTDGHRFSEPYASMSKAMDDADMRRRLYFGEELS